MTFADDAGTIATGLSNIALVDPSCKNSVYTKARVPTKYSATAGNITIDGVSYPIFKTSPEIPGLGWMIMVKSTRTYASNQAIKSQADYQYIYPIASGGDQNISFGYQFSWVKYDNSITLPSGSYNVNLGTVLEWQCQNNSGNIVSGETGYLKANSITVTVDALTCDVDSTSETIQMPMASLYSLNNAPIGVYDNAQGETQITIKNCSAGVKPVYTVAAKVPVTGDKTLIGLQDTTVTGLALQLKLSDGTVLDVDGKTTYNLGQNGANIELPTTANETRALDLIANLYKTGTVTAGTYTALVDINVMYK